MKRFEFSLDRLLKVKRQLERLAELEEQRARRAADAARSTLRQYHDQLAGISGRFADAVGSALVPSQWAAASDMAERLGRSIHQAERDVAESEQKSLAASQERAQLSTEVEALNTLRRQQWERWRAEVQKADQERLDELSLRRWQAAQGEAIGGPQSPS